MTRTAAVEAQALTKHYRRWGKTRAFGTLKSAFLGAGFKKALAPSEFVAALNGVSFRVEHGETFGVVGANGSGKSTLLKLVAGILKPTSGRLGVDGKVSALIELGAGFHPEISGRENVIINGIMLGLSRREIEKKLPSIIEFSGLSGFMDQPVKTYSSGMYVRLGFAVAIHTDPSILVVDEVLAVGDEAFAHRCLDTIREFSARGKTIFFVTHSLALVEELCNRALYLEKGTVKGIGNAREILAAYRLDVLAEEGDRLALHHAVNQEELRAALPEAPSESHAPSETVPQSLAVEEEKPRRWGDRSAEITACRLLDESGRERYGFHSGEKVTIEMEVTPRRPLDDFVFGIGLFTPEDFCVHGTNTEIEGLLPDRLEGPVRVRITMPSFNLGAGTYLIDVAVHARRGTPYDYWRGACRFRMDTPRQDAGVYYPERLWAFDGPVSFKQ